MKSEDGKLYNKKYLIGFVLIAFIFHYFNIYLYSIRLHWNVDTSFLLGKSVTQPFMFLVWVIAFPIVVKLKNLFPYEKGKRKNILYHIPVSMVMASAIGFIAELFTIAALILTGDNYYMEYAERYFSILEMRLIDINYTGVIIYTLIFIYLSSIDYYKKYKNESLKRAEAESLIAKAELNALKMQIQPHFLFNTLHSISSLIDFDKEEAQDVIGRLGDLLRYTLDQHKNDFITLKTEISFIENYLEIEKARFKDRLTVNYNIATETEEIYIASFILQPLIENAIKHGLSKTNRNCTITIDTFIENDQLNIEVSDDGNGSEIIKNGIGLENTSQRLKNYYGEDCKFEYHNTVPQGFQVVMKIPVKYQNDFV